VEDRGGPLLERENELSRLEGLLNVAVAGSGALAVIEGPAGIGKSALICEFEARCKSGNVRVFRARGTDLEAGFAFGVVRQLFEGPLSAATKSERQGWLAGAAGLSLPLWEPAPAQVVGPDTSFTIAHGLYWLLANLADEEPVVVTIDDCHLADEPSLQWLSYVAHRLDGVPSLVVLGMRTGEAVAHAGALQALSHEPTNSLVRLKPLSTDASADLVRVRLGPQASDGFCDACCKATQGNPFFLHELLNALADDNVTPDEASAPLVAAQSPAAIRRSLLVRLSRLGEAPSALARAVAVLGPGAELRHAANVACLDLDAAAASDDKLAEVQLLASGSPLAFVHPIVDKAVTADLAPGKRASLHSRAAKALADEAAPAERIAAHLLHTEPAGLNEVVDALRAAAGEALARGSPANALTYLRRALEEPPRADQSAELLAALGQAAFLVGDPAVFDYLRRAHDEATDPLLRALVVGQEALALIIAEKMEQAVAVLEAGIAEFGDTDPEVSMALEAALFGVAVLVASARSRLLDRVEMMQSRVLGDTPASRMLLAALATWALSENRPRVEVRDLSLRAIAGGRLLEEQGSSSQLFYMAINPLSFCGEFELAEFWLDRALKDAQDRGSMIASAIASCWRAWPSWLQGDLTATEGYVRAGLTPGGNEAAIPSWALGAIPPLIVVLIEQGRLNEAEELLRSFPPSISASDSLFAKGLLWAQARVALARGAPADALDAALEWADWTRRLDVDMTPVLPWRPTAAFALVSLGKGERGFVLAEEHVAQARSVDNPWGLGSALRTLAGVSGDHEAIALLRESVAILQGSGAMLELAHSQVELGSALRRRNQREAARQPLAAGLRLALRCAASELAVRAEDELRLSGARTPRTATTGIAELTPAEWRVADLTRRGLRNREIAQALFVSLKTVETHLGRIYQKLGVTSRVHLADALESDRS
jgi:ATP/maltotriose-dependent transcriptional regulator MalT